MIDPCTGSVALTCMSHVMVEMFEPVPVVTATLYCCCAEFALMPVARMYVFVDW